MSSMGSSLTASILGTWVLFPGARLQAQEGKAKLLLVDFTGTVHLLLYFLSCFVL